ncbi:MAG: YkvA family protein [Candidatus Binatia bacterium]
MALPSSNLTTWQVFRILRHLPNFVKLYWRLFKDARVPLRAKIILFAAVLYLVSPFDLLPDFFLPLMGRIDDLVVLIIGARWFISLCPPDVVQEHVKKISSE